MPQNKIDKIRELSEGYKDLIMELVEGDKDIFKLELRDCTSCYKRLRKLLLEHEKNTREFKKMLFNMVRKPMLDEKQGKNSND
jgi:hypothetical protein